MDESESLESSAGPPVVPPVHAFASYPRQPQEKELKRGIRYLRGFVIGNYWMGAASGAFLGVAFLAGAFSRPHHSRNSESDIGIIVATLFFAAFFLVGFCIGVYSRRKRVSVIISAILSFFAGIMWLIGPAQAYPAAATVLLFLYAGLGLTAAIFVNRAASKVEPQSSAIR